MARNGSGTYSKVNTFTSGTTITAASHNQNWDDAAAEITNSVAVDGQSTMTGPLKAASGTAAAPSITFGSDPDTGAYRSAGNEYSVAAGGVRITKVTSAGLDVTTGTVLIAGVAAFPVPTAQITDNSVTYAKIQEVAASKLLGNPTVGATEVSEITLSGGLAFSGTALKATTVPFTVQRFTSGSGTYTTPAGCTAIRIRLVGGGSGGGGGNNSSGATGGGASTFSGGSLSAGGAAGGASATTTTPVAGGAASGGNIANIPGGTGTAANSAVNSSGGMGGGSFFGGGGGGGSGSGAGSVGATNSGSGGGGGGGGSASAAAGGSAGGYVEHIISSPAATYTYAVGAGGAGVNGTSAGNGAAGATGILIVEEYY